MYNLRVPHESAVSADRAADAGLLAAYNNYIHFEEAQDEPARVRCIFERAIAVFPTTLELWVRYLRYLEQKLRVSDVTRAVYARAVRNCPRVGSLHTAYMRFEERHGAAPEIQAELLNAALASGLRTPEEHLE
eukprot:1932179-Pyramimonas_sp.AAC.1